MDQVGTALQEYVLAVVHNLAGSRMLIRRSSAADVGAALEQSNFESSVSKRAPSSQACQPAANNTDCLRLRFRRHVMRSRNPRKSTFSFSQRLRWTRSVKTS